CAPGASSLLGAESAGLAGADVSGSEGFEGRGCCDWRADSTLMELVSRVISASSGERGPGLRVIATNRERTSKAAAMDAAVDCARNIGGSALVGLLLAQAATTSLTAWFSSSVVRWMLSRLSRIARDTAWSMAVGSCGINIWGRNRRKCPVL